MPEPVLLVEKRDGVAILTLNRPNQMNALSAELRAALVAELTALRSDRETGVVILTGAGRAFCAGLDLKELGSADRAGGAIPADDPPKLLRSLRQPVIGAINGVAVTGGLEVALSCDVLIASPDARFADTHARVGLLAGWGLGARLSRTIGLYRAKELSLTGNYLTAERAYEWGLVNRVVPAEELLPTCETLAKEMLSCVPDAMFEYKRQIDRAYDLSLGDAMIYEADISRKHQAPPPEVIAERLGGIKSRGRSQTSGS